MKETKEPSTFRVSRPSQSECRGFFGTENPPFFRVQLFFQEYWSLEIMLKNWDGKEKHPSEKYQVMHPAHSVGRRGHAKKDEGWEGMANGSRARRKTLN